MSLLESSKEEINIFLDKLFKNGINIDDFKDIQRAMNEEQDKRLMNSEALRPHNCVFEMLDKHIPSIQK